MLKFAVTSANSVKVSAVETALKKILKENIAFSVHGFASKSDISEQPMSLEETKRGAINRIINCEASDIDYYISVESGAEREFDNVYEFTFAAVSDKHKNKFGFGLSSKFAIPDNIANQLMAGEKSLGQILPHPTGLIGYSTNELMKRFDLINEAVTTALITMNFFYVPLPENPPKELVQFFDSLNYIEKNSLAEQLRMIDFREKKIDDNKINGSDIEPVKEVTDYTEEYNDLVDNGTDSLCNGEVAVVLIANELGISGSENLPKALHVMNIPSKSTPLELHLRRLKKLESKYCFGKKAIPIYIITNDFTHSSIASYLIRKQKFGLNSIKLIRHRSLPIKLPNGSYALQEKSKVLVSSSCDVFTCLNETGALNEIKHLGVKYIDIHMVDNILAKPADPAFIGSLIYEEAEMSIKVIKTSQNNEIRCLGKTNKGKYAITETSNEFSYGYAEMSLFSIEFIDKILKAQLPYHILQKEAHIINENGESENKTIHQLEKDINDILNICEKLALFEVNQEEEFAPLKSTIESIENAKNRYLNLHRKWVTSAGAVLKESIEIEFSPETTYFGEDIEYMNLADQIFDKNTIL